MLCGNHVDAVTTSMPCLATSGLSRFRCILRRDSTASMGFCCGNNNSGIPSMSLARGAGPPGRGSRTTGTREPDHRDAAPDRQGAGARPPGRGTGPAGRGTGPAVVTVSCPRVLDARSRQSRNAPHPAEKPRRHHKSQTSMAYRWRIRPRLAELDQLLPDRHHHRFHPRMNLQLLQDVAHVVLDRVLGDE
jgi:hypothetical protein